MRKVRDESAEIAKRLEKVEEYILTLKEKLSENEKNQGKVVLAIEKLSHQLTESFNAHAERLQKIEKTTSRFDFFFTHWKTILAISFFLFTTGAAFEFGFKGIIHAIQKYKLTNVGKLNGEPY